MTAGCEQHAPRDGPFEEVLERTAVEHVGEVDEQVDAALREIEPRAGSIESPRRSSCARR